MAICRCEEHPPTNNRTHVYNHAVYPIGYPNTSSLCGRCENAGLIYLTDAEYNEYLGGEDVFVYSTNESKVWVQNPNRE